MLLTSQGMDDKIVQELVSHPTQGKSTMFIVTATFAVAWGTQSRILHDTDEATVRAMPGFLAIESVQPEPVITWEMVTSNGRFSCE